MVSLTMMARLLEAVRAGARLVLVGDADQLASVEAGAVLRDLVDGWDPPAPSGGEGGAAGAYGVAAGRGPVSRLLGQDRQQTRDRGRLAGARTAGEHRGPLGRRLT